MTNPLHVLVIVTSAATMGQGGEPTGLWFEELTTPYYAFVDEGADVTLASIEGGEAPIDPRSLEPEGGTPESVTRFKRDEEASAALKNTKPISEVDVSKYDAVFLPGGHGTMWDLPESQTLADLLTKAWADGKVVAAVCHGPAGLVNAKDENGDPLVKGRRVTAFTNSEEVAVDLKDKVPFLLEDRLKELGANYEKAGDFQPFAVVDGRLVTGQNPASSAEAAKLTLEAVKQTAPATN
ncbi:Molecular chaperone Hsp31 and glyoxalase 3 [Methyloligella halotolerans]|uniref:Molecular chaperone Hsp31 and glyoxalase 3 n=1 Tax=Methyloligella halotolerans TaxID=1177755 RepID=A0A1E2S0X8_9HYPH|nr:type 1 glutamine amidotransferase domain-containing protein [Methyloligella halotolerans]ODA67979.1 Molecular chaperone Hsp31 and glyoxalase 3 [Methyloligella halotolerans]